MPISATIIAYNEADTIAACIDGDAAAVLMQMGEVPAAVELLERDIPAAEPRAFLFVAQALCYRELGRKDQAAAACRRALELEPGHHDAAFASQWHA